jgi:hypothetical protein
MTEPEGLDIIISGRICVKNSPTCLGTLEYARIISSEVAWKS